MIEFLVVVVVAIVVVYADFRMTIHNNGVAGNGLGSVPFVNGGSATLPAQHRVLVPWLCHYIDYYYLRWLAIGLALVSAWLYFGTCMTVPIVGVLLLALYFVWAAVFDYTDGYIEVALFALAFYLAINYSLSLAPLAIGFFAGLNRESSVFIPICLVLDGYWFAGLLAGVGFIVGGAIPRIMYSGAERYCGGNQMVDNWERMIESYRDSKHILHNEWTSFIVLFLALVGIYAVVPWSGVHIGMIFMFTLLVVPTVWAEIRVFAPIVLFAIPLLGGLL